MKIIKAEKKHAKKISEFMLSEIEDNLSKFPKEIIDKVKEHSKEENIRKEFKNPKLISFLAMNNKITGFIVGYEEKNFASIHYLVGNNKIKKKLLDVFIIECKARNLINVIADVFEFQSNNNLLKSYGFKLLRKEKLGNLNLLWYFLKLGD